MWVLLENGDALNLELVQFLRIEEFKKATYKPFAVYAVIPVCGFCNFKIAEFDSRDQALSFVRNFKKPLRNFK